MEPCWAWPLLSGVTQLLVQFSWSTQVHLLLVFLCHTWGDPNACFIGSEGSDTHRHFYCLCHLLHLTHP